MADETEDVVGFSLADAEALLDQLDGTKSRSNVDHRRQPRFSLMLGQVKTGGLAPGAEGSVWLMYPTATGWAVSSDSCPCWGIGSSLVAGDTVLIVPTDGRWLGLKVC